jgi:peptide/nickel transport system substrate-binding protein
VNEEAGDRVAVTDGTRIHTFLIADVRGWTLFTQQRGDEAAAKLAAKFARIAREVVQSRDGEVIELRGDEALAVFSSARQAVSAAVDLQERFVDETIGDPELPIPVGIGLDAGEAVPVEGGYRGAALNLAARLCGQAGPAEILASRGITHLAGRVDGVRFVDRGKVRLKNLAEPVEVVRIVPEGVDPAERLRRAAPPTGRGLRRSSATIAAIVGLVLAVALGATILALRREGETTIEAGGVGLLNPSGDLEGTAEVGGLPRGMVRGAGSLWVADQAKGSLVRVDPSTFQVQERIPVGIGATGVAIADGVVWVTNIDERTVSVVDPEAGRVVQTIVVGNGPSGIVGGGDRVWVTNSVDATVTEIDAATGDVLGRYPVGERPVAAAVASGAVWIVNASGGSVSRVVPGEGETETIPVGRGPAAIAAAFGSLWVANADDGTVTTIDAATGSVTGTEPVGRDPVARAAAGDAMWVASARDRAVSRIDPATMQVTETYDVGNEPRTLTGTESGLWIGAEASAETHRGGTLRLVTEEAFSIDPHHPDAVSTTVLASTYDGLVTFRKAGGAAGSTVVPDLAVSLPVPTDGGLTYTFTLRDGIRFSNGHVLTPDDVVATVERVLLGKGYSRFYFTEIVGASTCTPKDPAACDLTEGVVADAQAGTVTFHLIRPAPDFLKALATPWSAIVPAGTPIELEGEPIPATGPYAISDVRDDGSLVLERNPSFEEWSTDAQPAAFADRVEIHVVGQNQRDQVAMVERGEADVGLDGVPTDLVEELERRASDQMVVTPFRAIGALALNTGTHPFERRDARAAVAYALDRVELSRAWSEVAANADDPSVAEFAEPACQILPPSTPGYAPYCPFTTPGADPAGTWAGPDLARALRLVERSGTAGAKVTIAMTPCLEPTADVVAATLRDLGYRVDLETDGPLRDPSSDCWFGPLSPDQDVSFSGWVSDYPSPAQFLVPLLSCTVDGTPYSGTTVTGAGVGGYSFNASFFCDRDLDRRMQRALGVQLTDPHAAARAFEAVEHDLVDQAPLIPIGNGIDIWLVSKRVSNVEINPQLYLLVSQVWVR